MSCIDIPILSQRPTMPPTVRKALDIYTAASEESTKAYERYTSVCEEKRANNNDLAEWVIAIRKTDEAWFAYTKLYNHWVENPEDFEPSQESIELRNL